MLPLFILLPFIGLLILNLPLGSIYRRAGSLAVITLSVAQIAAVLFLPADLMMQDAGVLKRLAPLLLADDLSQVFLLAIGLVVLATALAGKAMFPTVRERFFFVNFLLLSMAGMNATVLLTDLFSLYVFIEVIALSSFVLIAFRRDRIALEGSLKYLLLSTVATVLMLSAVALLLVATGSTGFSEVRSALQGASHTAMVRVAMGLFVCGLFIKGGLVPFHGWLPGAYTSAPAPVSILLAGIVTKVSGIYALIRLTAYVFPPSVPLNQTLLLVGALSIMVGAISAIGQKDMKWLLSYSSISQVGYILLGLGCGTTLGLAAAVFHLFNHATFKSLLFVNAAAVEQRVGTTDMSKLGGLGSRMPITGTTSVIGLLSLAGIPPFAGFWSKLMIVIALWQVGLYGFAVIAVGFSVVTLAYLLIMQRRVFFGKLPAELGTVKEASFGLTLPAILLAAVTTVVGLAFPWLTQTFIFPHAGIF